MTTITHICTGYIVSQIAIQTGLVSSEIIPHLPLVSMIAANAPDFDIVSVKHIPLHRLSAFHTPFYWFIFFVVSYGIISITHQRNLAVYLAIISMNVFLHFCMDSISLGRGIRWLMPFVKKDFGIIIGKPAVSAIDVIKDNFKIPLILIETPVWITTYLLARGIWKF
jgi:membrane-bound metal-dependent hydrolase YbcI (DUF457 family)